jgi:K+-transporting ATPase ATPase C chain
MVRQLKISLIVLGLFVLITGIIYPLVVTGIAQLVFNHQANGSLIVKDGKSYGSELIGQPFSDPRYFWGRLSATSPVPYNASSSSGSNLSPSNPALLDNINSRIRALKAVDPSNAGPIPVDLVTSSGSGLDPHISLAAAEYQLRRVARYRSMSEDSVKSLVIHYTEGRQFGILGEPRVNVLLLNMALDQTNR